MRYSLPLLTKVIKMELVGNQPTNPKLNISI